MHKNEYTKQRFYFLSPQYIGQYKTEILLLKSTIHRPIQNRDYAS